MESRNETRAAGAAEGDAAEDEDEGEGAEGGVEEGVVATEAIEHKITVTVVEAMDGETPTDRGVRKEGVKASQPCLAHRPLYQF